MDRTNPQHYRDEAVIVDGKRYEPINICECYNFCLGNALKYLLRAEHHKDGVKLNYQKAKWYLNRLFKQDLMVYPKCDGNDVAKVLAVYRMKFPIIATLLEPSGLCSIIGINGVIKQIDEALNELN